MKMNKKIIYLFAALLVIGAVLVKHDVIEFGGEETNIVSFNADELAAPIGKNGFETTGCRVSGCLFTNYGVTAGYSIVKGYYVQFPSTDMNGAEVMCAGFAMTEGPEEIVDDFWYQADGIQAFALESTYMQEGDLLTVVGSTEDSPVEVAVLSQYFITGSGMDSCSSMEQIVNVFESHE